jgi:hypothetical protein
LARQRDLFFNQRSKRSTQPAKYEANRVEAAAMAAEFYVEEMKLHFDAADA